MATVKEIRKRVQTTIQAMYLSTTTRPYGYEFIAARVVTEKVLDYLEAIEGRANPASCRQTA